MFNKKMMQLPGVSVKRSVLIGLLRSLSFLTDIAIIIYLADILALLCGATPPAGHRRHTYMAASIQSSLLLPGRQQRQ